MWLMLGFVVVVLVGNMMGVKPKQADVRLDKLRMTARQHGFLPKLAKTPDWLAKTTQKTMLSQYILVLDEMKLPFVVYINDQGVWRLLEGVSGGHQNAIKKSEPPKILPLLESFAPYAYGLVAKANSLVLLWNDEQFSLKYPDDKKNNEHIQAIKEYLTELAHQINTR